MKTRRRFSERFKWRMNDRLPGQTLKRKKWIVTLIVLTAAFDWFFIVFGINVILPHVLDTRPPYLPEKYAQAYTHISTLKGYTDGHNPVLVFSPDSKTLATSAYREARLWDVETGEHLRTLETDMNQVRALAFHVDGKIVVGVIESTASRGSYQFAVWDLNASDRRPSQPTQCPFHGKQYYSIHSKDKTPLTSHTNTPDDITTVFSQDNTNVISLGYSGSVWVLDLERDRLLHHQVVGSKSLKRMQFAAFHFASELTDEINIRWNRKGGQVYTPFPPPIVLNRQGTRSLSFFTAPTHQVTALMFSPDGKTLVSGGYRREIRLWDAAFGEIRLWDIDTSKQIAFIPAPGSSVTTLAFSPDGKILAGGNQWFGEGTILIWDLEDRRLRSVITTEHRSSITALVFAPDNVTLASADDGGTVHLWDITGRTNR